jgi:protein-S-isoprenylcysteine O-methyltransferase Ste14
MNNNEIQIIVAVLLIGFVVHRGYYIRKMQRSDDSVIEQPKLGKTSRIASLLAIPAFLSTIIYIVAPAWMSWSALPLPTWMRWGGVAMALVGFGLLQWSQQTLGKNWSDAPKLFTDQKLVVDGPYRWIRHPIYTAFLLILGSLLLITANWFIGTMWISMTALDVAARMDAEEAMMISQFGNQYRAYMQQTGRLLPRLSRRKHVKV